MASSSPALARAAASAGGARLEDHPNRHHVHGAGADQIADQMRCVDVVLSDKKRPAAHFSRKRALGDDLVDRRADRVARDAVFGRRVRARWEGASCGATRQRRSAGAAKAPRRARSASPSTVPAEPMLNQLAAVRRSVETPKYTDIGRLSRRDRSASCSCSLNRFGLDWLKTREDAMKVAAFRVGGRTPGWAGRRGATDGRAIRSAADEAERRRARADRARNRCRARSRRFRSREVALDAPIPRPRRNMFCVGKNYHEHAHEFAASGFDSSAASGAVPKHPIIFSKVPGMRDRPSADGAHRQSR